MEVSSSTYYFVVGMLSLMLMASIANYLVYKHKTVKELRREKLKLDFLRALANPAEPELNLTLASIMDFRSLRDFSINIEGYFLEKIKMWHVDKIQTFLERISSIMVNNPEGKRFVIILLRNVISNMEPEVLADCFIRSISKKANSFCQTSDGNAFIAESIKGWSLQGKKKELFVHLEEQMNSLVATETGPESEERIAYIMAEYYQVKQAIGMGKN